MTLQAIHDPELPVSIYDLGLIYKIDLSPLERSQWETNLPMFDADILMTLTAPSCPVAESLPVEVEDRLKQLANINKCKVEITFDPPWSMECMSEEAKLELGFL